MEPSVLSCARRPIGEEHLDGIREQTSNYRRLLQRVDSMTAWAAQWMVQIR